MWKMMVKANCSRERRRGSRSMKSILDDMVRPATYSAGVAADSSR
jgi:hypothetical protein